MFEKRVRSLRDLTDCELRWAIDFLNGTPWAEQFDEFEDLGPPPMWLIDWSATWERSSIYFLVADPFYEHGHLVNDRGADEVWFVIEGEDNTAKCVAQVLTSVSPPIANTVCPVVLRHLDALASAAIDYHFVVNPKWLPREEMRTLLRRVMCENNVACLECDTNLTLDRWLQREYIEDHRSDDPKIMCWSE